MRSSTASSFTAGDWLCGDHAHAPQCAPIAMRKSRTRNRITAPFGRANERLYRTGAWEDCEFLRVKHFASYGAIIA